MGAMSTSVLLKIVLCATAATSVTCGECPGKYCHATVDARAGCSGIIYM